MGVVIRYLLTVTIAICLTFVESVSLGLADFYDPPYVPSACFGYQDHGTMVAGVGDELWDNGAACGKSIDVICVGPIDLYMPNLCRPGLINVTIVDYNPGAKTIINLSKTAFSLIADPNAGEVYVNVNVNS